MAAHILVAYPDVHVGMYSSGKIRAYLRRRGIDYTIPRKSNERRNGPFNRIADTGGLSFLEFFQTDKDTGRTKGIIAIDLGGLA